MPDKRRTTLRWAARLGRLGVLVAASAALVALPAMPASAHNYVVATTPAEGAVLTAQPGTVSLETNEALLAVESGSVVQVQGPDGRYYGDGCAVVDGATATTQTQLGEPGTYTVNWRVVSVDGHPISGMWTFEWQPVDGIALADGSDEPGACGGAAATVPEATNAPDDSEDSAESAEATTAAPLDALWIVGGVLLAAVAAIITWLVLRRRE